MLLTLRNATKKYDDSPSNWYIAFTFAARRQSGDRPKLDLQVKVQSDILVSVPSHLPDYSLGVFR